MISPSEFVRSVHEEHAKQCGPLLQEMTAVLANTAFPFPWIYLFELTQNALDAGARRIRIDFADDRVIFQHDGGEAMDEKCVRAMSKVGGSTKGLDTIGFMGVGFKSVFARFRRVVVASGAFRFAYRISIDVTGSAAWTGMLLPEWQEGSAAPDQGYTTRFDLCDPAPESRGRLAEDALRLVPLEGPAHLLATLAFKGLRELIVDGRVWSLDYRAEEQIVEALSHATRWVWLALSQRYRVHDDALTDFLSKRILSISKLEPDERRAQLNKDRQLIGFVPLSADGLPDLPPRGAVFTSLPTAVTLGLRMHLQGEWQVDLARQGLRELGPWQKTITQQIPALVSMFLRWAASGPPERLRPALDILTLAASGGTEIDGELASKHFSEATALALRDVPFLPVHVGGARKTVAPGVVVCPHRRLTASFAGRPQRRSDVLFGAPVLDAEEVGKVVQSRLREIGLLKERTASDEASCWRQTMAEWWALIDNRSAPEDARGRVLVEVLGGVSALCSRDSAWEVLAILPTDTGGVRNVQDLTRYDQALPGDDVIVGELGPYLLQAEDRVAKEVLAALSGQGLDDEKRLDAMRAREWFERSVPTKRVVDAIADGTDALFDKGLLTPELVVAVSNWARLGEKERAPAVRYVAVDCQGTQVVPIGSALVAEPFSEHGRLRRELFPTAPAISDRYLDGDPQATGAWRTFFERLGALGPLRLLETCEEIRQHEVDRVIAFLGLSPAELNKARANNRGYELMDRALPPVALTARQGVLLEWLEADPSVFDEKAQRAATYYFGAVKKTLLGRAACEWTRQLSNLAWVRRRGGDFVKPDQALPPTEAFLGDPCCADMSPVLFKHLQREGLAFAQSAPTAALSLLESPVVPRDPSRLAALLREAMEAAGPDAEQRAELRRRLQAVVVPTLAGGLVRVSQLVAHAGSGGRAARSSLGEFVVALNQIEESLRSALVDCIEVPATTTGMQALARLQDVWRLAHDGTPATSEELRRVLPFAYAYVLDDAEESAELRAQWELARSQAYVYAGRSWVPVETKPHVDDLFDPRIRSRIPSDLVVATASHFGESREQVERTARALGLPMLSETLRPEWREGRRIYPEWLDRMTGLCVLLARQDVRLTPMQVRIHDSLSLLVQGTSIEVHACRGVDGALVIAGKPEQFMAEATEQLIAHYRMSQRGLAVPSLTGAMLSLDRPRLFKAHVARMATQLGIELLDEPTVRSGTVGDLRANASDAEEDMPPETPERRSLTDLEAARLLAKLVSHEIPAEDWNDEARLHQHIGRSRKLVAVFDPARIDMSTETHQAALEVVRASLHDLPDATTAERREATEVLLGVLARATNPSVDPNDLKSTIWRVQPKIAQDTIRAGVRRQPWAKATTFGHPAPGAIGAIAARPSDTPLPAAIGSVATGSADASTGEPVASDGTARAGVVARIGLPHTSDLPTSVVVVRLPSLRTLAARLLWESFARERRAIEEAVSQALPWFDEWYAGDLSEAADARGRVKAEIDTLHDHAVKLETSIPNEAKIQLVLRDVEELAKQCALDASAPMDERTWGIARTTQWPSIVTASRLVATLEQTRLPRWIWPGATGAHDSLLDRVLAVASDAVLAADLESCVGWREQFPQDDLDDLVDPGDSGTLRDRLQRAHHEKTSVASQMRLFVERSFPRGSGVLQGRLAAALVNLEPHTRAQEQVNLQISWAALGQAGTHLGEAASRELTQGWWDSWEAAYASARSIIKAADQKDQDLAEALKSQEKLRHALLLCAPYATRNASESRAETELSLTLQHPVSFGDGGVVHATAAQLSWRPLQRDLDGHSIEDAKDGTLLLPVRLKIEPPFADDTTLDIVLSGRWRDTYEASNELVQRHITGSVHVPRAANSIESTLTIITSRAFAEGVSVQSPLRVSVQFLLRGQNVESAMEMTWTAVSTDSPYVLAQKLGGMTLPTAVTAEQVLENPIGIEKRYPQLLALVEAGRTGFCVYGYRRYGKSSLVSAVAKNATASIVIDPVTASVGMPQRTWQEIKDHLADKKLGRANCSELVDGLLPGRDAFDGVRAEAHNAGKRAIYLVIDEAQNLLAGTDRGAHTERLKGLIEHWAKPEAARVPLLFGFVGQMRLADQLGGNLLPALQSFKTSAMNDAEMDDVLRVFSAGGTLQSTSEARNALARATGNLFVLNLALRRVTDRCATEQRTWFLARDVDEIVEEMAKHCDGSLWRYLRDPLNQNESIEQWSPAETFPVALAWARALLKERVDPEAHQQRIEELLSVWGDLAKPVPGRVKAAMDRLLGDEVVVSNQGGFEFRPAMLGTVLAARSMKDRPLSEPEEQAAVARLGLRRITVPPRIDDVAHEGGQANVYAARDPENPKRTLTVRRISLSGATMRQFVREVELLFELRDRCHTEESEWAEAARYLPRFHDAGLDQDDPQSGIVMYEWVPGTELASESLTDHGLTTVGRRLSLVLAKLAELHLVHRDIALPNVLLRPGTGRDGAALEPVLIDFGLAKKLVPGEERTQDLAGRLDYLPKEILDRRHVTQAQAPKADVFQLGKTLEHAWKTGTHPGVRAILVAMMADEPDDRISAREAYKRFSDLELELERRGQYREIKEEVAAHLQRLPRSHDRFRTDAEHDLVGFAAWIAGRTARLLRRLTLAKFLEDSFQEAIKRFPDEGNKLQERLRSGGQRRSTYLLAAPEEFGAKSRPEFQPFGEMAVAAVGRLRNAQAHPATKTKILQDVLRDLGISGEDPEGDTASAKMRMALIHVAAAIDGLCGSGSAFRELAAYWVPEG